MTKIGTPLTETYEDSGFDEFLSRPFEGLGPASREWQEQTGYSYEDLAAHMENSNIHAREFTTTIAFSSDDYRTVSWGTGAIEYKDGKVTPTIAASDTGNMSARTYIYYDPQADKAALQTTTTASIATKGERILLAIAVPNATTTKMAEIQTFGATGVYVPSLSAEHITSGSIRSKTVTLAIDAGEGDCYFNAGKTDYTNTDGGFILGLDDSDSDKAKFYIGDSSVYLNWTGSALSISGADITLDATSDITVGGDSINTNAEIIIHLTPGSDSTSSQNSYEDIPGSNFKLDGDNFTNQNVYFEANIGMSTGLTGQCYARLYDVTDSAAVANSEVIGTVNQQTPELCRSSAITFDSSEHEYKVQHKVTGSDADEECTTYLARLIYIQQ